MKRKMRWLLPVTAAVGLVLGVSGMSARGADDDKKPEGKGSITGTVVDKDGKGVAEVTVRLMKPMMRRPGGPGGPGGDQKPPKDQAAGNARQGAVGLEDDQKPAPPSDGQRPPRPKPVAEATTDKDGKFEMKDVPAGDYMIGVRDQDKKVFGGTRVTVKDGETETVSIKTSDKPMRGAGGQGGQGGGHRGPGGNSPPDNQK